MRIIIFSVILSIWGLGLSYAQDSWTHSVWNGKVVDITKGGKTLFEYNVPSSMPPVRLTASPSGKVLFLEDLDYEKDPEAERRQKVHVCNEEGREIQSFIIKQRPNEFYNYARFYGESIIVLSEIGRKYGKVRETVLITKSEKAFTWSKAFGDSYRAAFFPKENKALSVVLFPKWKTSFVYLNGDLIYPQYKAQAEDGLIGVRSFKDQMKSESLPESMVSDPEVLRSVGQSLFLCGGDSIWSADGRYAALIEIPSEFDKSEKGEEIQKRGSLLVLDTEGAKLGTSPHKYTFRIPIESPLSEYMVNHYQVKWSENDQLIQVMRKSENPSQPSKLIEEHDLALEKQIESSTTERNQ